MTPRRTRQGRHGSEVEADTSHDDDDNRQSSRPPPSCGGRLMSASHGCWPLFAVVAVLMILSTMIGSRNVGLDDVLAAYGGSAAGFDQAAVAKRIPRTLLAVCVGAALGISGAVMQGVTRNPLADPGIPRCQHRRVPGRGHRHRLLRTVNGRRLHLVRHRRRHSHRGVRLCGRVTREAGCDPAQAGPGRGGHRRCTVVVHQRRGPPPRRHRGSGTRLADRRGRGCDVRFGHTHPSPSSSSACSSASIRRLASMPWPSAMSSPPGWDSTSAPPEWSPLQVRSSSAGQPPPSLDRSASSGSCIPHACRLLIGIDHRWLIPFSAVTGAALLTASDILGRIIARPAELDVGILTALIGAPFFIAIVRRQKVRSL